MKNSNLKSIILLAVLMVCVILALSFARGNILRRNQDPFLYSDVVDMFEKDLVVSFEVDDDLKMTLKTLIPKEGGGYETDSKGEYVYKTYTYQIGYNFQLADINEMAQQKYLAGNTNLIEYNYKAQGEAPWYQLYLPYIIIFVLIIGVILFFMFHMQSAGGPGKMNSFSKSHAKVTYNAKDAVKFADVAGADEEKAELEEVVEFLKDPQKFLKLGARIPRGVLLVGPPGTGKTLLAKAVAGEAGVPFFSISGSDFVEMYVGVGASRVRDLFESARRTPASIIFIDEIDAVGRHRGAGLGGGHDEREQTLNQLLVEMDGFGTNSGVIVMAATNRPDILDPALLRPGRFDRRVTVNYPDMNGREAILKVHCRNKPLEDTVDLRKIAQTTINFSGADLANLMNEAALLAAKKGKSLIGMADIEESYMKMLLGPQKKNKVRRPEDNRLTAYHEAGHAVASYYCKHTDPVKHITIIPAGSAGGVTVSVPLEDRMVATRNEMFDQIVLALGGRVAEELILDDISTGASNDIQQATNIARNMVTRYGMSDRLGTVLYGSEHSADEVFLGRDFSSGTNYSEKTAAEIDEEIRRIISDAYATCKKSLSEHLDKLHFVAQFLLKNETMDADQFAACMEQEAPTMEEIEQIAENKKRRSEEENKIAHEATQRQEEEIRQRAREEAERLYRETMGEGTVEEDGATDSSVSDSLDQLVRNIGNDGDARPDGDAPKNDESKDGSEDK